MTPTDAKKEIARLTRERDKAAKNIDKANRYGMVGQATAAAYQVAQYDKRIAELHALT